MSTKLFIFLDNSLSLFLNNIPYTFLLAFKHDFYVYFFVIIKKTYTPTQITHFYFNLCHTSSSI